MIKKKYIKRLYIEEAYYDKYDFYENNEILEDNGGWDIK